jgi:hypothetical protein
MRKKDVQTKTQTLNGVKIKLISSPNDKLFVMNKAVFKVCQTCGYAFSRTKKPTGLACGAVDG